MLRLTAGFERPDCGSILKGHTVLSDQRNHVALEMSDGTDVVAYSKYKVKEDELVRFTFENAWRCSFDG